MVENKTQKILLNLPKFMRRDPNSNNYKYTNSFSPEFENMDDQILGLKQAIQISTATGAYLDDIGELFQLERNGSESDESYRTRIIGYFAGIGRGGTIEAIKTAVAATLNITQDDVTVTEVSPMQIQIVPELGTLSVDLSAVNDVVQETKAAGIHAVVNFDLPVIDAGVVEVTDAVSTSTYTSGIITIDQSWVGGPDVIG